MKNWLAWLWLVLAGIAIVCGNPQPAAGVALTITHISSIECIESDSSASFLPMGLSFGPSGRLAVVDGDNSCVRILGPDLRKVLLEISCPGQLNTCRFTDVEMEISGIYVSEATSGEILRFDNRGNLKNRYAVGKGLTGISIDEGRIYAVLSLDGLVKTFPIGNDRDVIDIFMERRQESYPVDCVVVPWGMVGVTDANGGRVALMSHLGNWMGDLAGIEFKSPCGIAVYRQKYILVCDAEQGWVAVFDSNGFVLVFGKENLVSPTFVACRDDGTICVADSQKMTIEVFKIDEVNVE